MRIGAGLALACLLLAGAGRGTNAMTLSPLKECPQTPNCVSTQTRQADKLMAPVAFAGDPAAARAAIKSVVLAEPRTALQTENDDYLHFTFKSRLFRFVDDVEFFVDAEAGTIHFRSASRTGRSDLGVNRRRMTTLAEKIGAALR